MLKAPSLESFTVFSFSAVVAVCEGQEGGEGKVVGCSVDRLHLDEHAVTVFLEENK